MIRVCRGCKDFNNKILVLLLVLFDIELVNNDDEDVESKVRKRRGIGEFRIVVIYKDKVEGLGIFIIVRSFYL